MLLNSLGVGSWADQAVRGRSRRVGVVGPTGVAWQPRKRTQHMTDS